MPAKAIHPSQKRDAKIGRENRTRATGKTKATRQAIIECLFASQAPLSRADISQHINLGLSRTSDYLRELVNEGAIVSSGGSRWRVYSLADTAEAQRAEEGAAHDHGADAQETPDE